MASTLPSFTNVMMTLSALAATGATVRPSGETLAQQQQRILDGINDQLADKSLATAGAWSATWIALSADRGNMAYIAVGPSNQVAVCLRGTVVSSLVDVAEDLEVATLIPFGDGNISQGAMEAFTEITSAVDVLVETPTNLLQALTALVGATSDSLTIYVTGHSLGGAMATTVGLYLSMQTFTTQPTVQIVTFAAPTSGDQGFASQVDGMSAAPVAVVNQYDAIPQAWQTLSAIDGFYPYIPFDPKKPGPTAPVEVPVLVSLLGKLPGSPNPYVQPTQQPALNTEYSTFDPNAVGGPTKTSMAIFAQQVLFQHAGNTYLSLLGATQLPAVAPVLTSISPAAGPAAGGTVVTISGSGFSSDSVVDFGTLPATDVTVVSDSQITATAPALVGTVDVRVTNMFGTSPATAADRYTTPLATAA